MFISMKIFFYKKNLVVCKTHLALSLRGNIIKIDLDAETLIEKINTEYKDDLTNDEQC